MRSMFLIAVLALTLPAQTPPSERAQLFSEMDSRADHFGNVSRQIWEFAEVQLQEAKSAALLRGELAKNGFRIRDRIGGMETAFIAEWGQGKPVIAIMGEYDALPGLSQDTAPERKPLAEGGNGHGCGHNLFGAASAFAAVMVKEHLEARKLPGTIRFYGTPAEEGVGGKIFMIRAGAFQDVDAALVWHPWDRSAADNQSWLANISAKVRFFGRAAHAAAAPDAGRSALDAVEITTHAINLLREHVPQETRMHYVITKGGAAANIVPDAAELSLIVRHPDVKTLEGIWERVKNCAQAGATGSETRMEIEVTSSYANYLPNDTLLPIIDRNLNAAGGITYNAAERAFAEALRKTLTGTPPPLEDAARIDPPKTSLLSASTDVGDVSWVAPTGHFIAAAWVPGTAAHTWQSTAASGMSIGRKGMLLAAKTLALTALDLFHDPAQVTAAKASFERRKAGRAYRSLLPENRKPTPR